MILERDTLFYDAAAGDDGNELIAMTASKEEGSCLQALACHHQVLPDWWYTEQFSYDCAFYAHWSDITTVITPFSTACALSIIPALIVSIVISLVIFGCIFQP